MDDDWLDLGGAAPSHATFAADAQVAAATATATTQETPASTLSAVTESLTTSDSVDSVAIHILAADEAQVNAILGTPLAHARSRNASSFAAAGTTTPAAAAAATAVALTMTLGRCAARGIARGATHATHAARRHVRARHMRGYVVGACTRAAVGHVVGAIVTPAASIPWMLLSRVADNQCYVLAGACAATVLLVLMSSLSAAAAVQHQTQPLVFGQAGH